MLKIKDKIKVIKLKIKIVIFNISEMLLYTYRVFDSAETKEINIRTIT